MSLLAPRDPSPAHSASHDMTVHIAVGMPHPLYADVVVLKAHLQPMSYYQE